jgi:hypothetical protein
MHIMDDASIPTILVSALQALTASLINTPRPIDLGRGCVGLPGLRGSAEVVPAFQA